MLTRGSPHPSKRSVCGWKETYKGKTSLRECHFKHGGVNARIWGQNKWLLRRWHRPSCFGKKFKRKQLLGIFWKYHYHFATTYKDFRKVALEKTHVCCQLKIILMFYGWNP